MVQFELVSPERTLASTEAEGVTIPGQMGDMTAMAGHIPQLSTLRPGFVVLIGGEGTRYFVTGGFAEVGPETVSVLAEEAVMAEEATPDYLATKIEQAERQLDEAAEDRKLLLGQRVNDLRALAAQL
ncbi:MAG: ATP synthase F1 subunit epsilon [Pseudomonadota bacterium]